MVPQRKCFCLAPQFLFFVDHFPFCCSSLFLFVGVEGSREGPYPGDREKGGRLLLNMRDRPRRPPSLLLRRARPFAPSAVGLAAGNKSVRTRPQGRRVRKPRGDSISVGMGGQRRRLPTRGDPADEVHSASVAAHPMAAPRAEVSRPSVRVPYERKVVRENNRGGTANVARGPTGPPRSVIAPPAVSAPAERRPRSLFLAAAHPAFA